MAKNRKNQAAAVRFGTALKAALVCVALGGLGIGYVSLKNQLHALSRQIEKKEKGLERMRAENVKLAKQVATLRSPPFLHARVNDLGLNLAPPTPAQIVRLPEPPAPAATPTGETALEMAFRLQLAAGDAKGAAALR